MEVRLEDRVVHIDRTIFHKMVLIQNALDDGWSVKKTVDNASYVFTKKHEGRRECFTDEFLTDFMRNNLDVRRVLEKK